MQTIFTKLDPHQRNLFGPGNPIYMSRTQFEDAYYIPDEYKKRIIIVDFKEDTNGTNSFTENDGQCKATETSR